MDFKRIMNYCENLQLNNNRTWFHENHGEYELAKKDFLGFLDMLRFVINDEAPEVGKSIMYMEPKEWMYRIARDMRFHKNGPPYNPAFRAYISSDRKSRKPIGYFLRICPGSSCTDNADGTRTLRFELNDEKNPEPTPPDTCVPQSYHGAVMMPASMKDINTEVDKVVSKLPGVTVNNFELTYCDSTFEVTYDPTNDHVIEIVHHINVDIAANAKVAFSTIDGTARLTNDMRVYDINY